MLLTQVISALIALVSGKLIAIYILPKDFGIYNLQFATYTFFATLLINPFIQFIKTTNKTLLPKIGSKPYIFTIAALTMISYVSLITFLYIYQELFDGTMIVIFFFFITFSTVNKIFSDYLNINNRLILFSKLSVLESLSGLAFLALFFVLGLSFVKDYQILWLMQLFGILIGLSLYISNYRVFNTRFKVAYDSFLKKYFQFAGPLMFLAIWAWINNYFDRYAIEYYLTLEEVGVYNASYSVGSKFFLLVSPIFIILLTPLVYAVSKKNLKKKSVTKYSTYYIIIGIPLLILIFYLRDIIGSLLLSENYKEGFVLIFWVALAYFILTLGQLYELLFYSEQKTKVILVANVISALSNIVLNILMIPSLGLIGAAFATCLGFFIQFCVLFYYFKKL